MPHATGEDVCFLDDDDVWEPGARAAIEGAMLANPGHPIIFKMHVAATGGTLWTEPVLKMGNVGTPMLLLPNTESLRSGVWDHKYGNDFRFLESVGVTQDDVVWDPFVVATVRPIGSNAVFENNKIHATHAYVANLIPEAIPAPSRSDHDWRWGRRR